MKFKTFLLQEDSQLSFEEAIKLIAKKCKPFLTEAGPYPMFRGIAKAKVTKDGYQVRIEEIKFTKHPTGRPPRDSAVNFNILFDAMIDCAFNIKDVRTHSVFASGNPAIAGGYGTEHVIFPVGNFKYIWSPRVADSVSDWSGWLKPIARFGSQHGAQLSPTILKVMWDKYPGSEEQYFASKWVDGGRDVVNKTQAAYQYNEMGMQDIEESVYQMIKDGMKEYGEKSYENNIDLTPAIFSGNEILIHESSGYYSIPIGIAMDAYNKATGNKGSAEWSEMYTFILKEIAKVE
jgi:hypothetical protein